MIFLLRVGEEICNCRLLFEERFFLNLIPCNFEGADNDKTEVTEVSRLFRHTQVSKRSKK